jgi:RNA polymerase sigma-70 factor, ECF subfamily
MSSDTFEAVVLPYLDAAHNLARWLMRDAASAEDVLQEAMLRALTYFPSFKGVNPRGWLLQIVRNTAYASMSLNRGVELVPLTNGSDEAEDIVARLPSSDDDPETSLIKSRERDRVRQMIAALPIELRETLVLRELEELSYKEIAEVTRMPIGTVMSRLWRARRLLAQAARRDEAAGARCRIATRSCWSRPSSTASSGRPRRLPWRRIAPNARSVRPPPPSWLTPAPWSETISTSRSPRRCGIA